MKVKAILAAMVVAALACIAVMVLLPPGQMWPWLGALLAVLVVSGAMAVLALRRAARERRHEEGGMDLEQLRARPREVSQDDTVW